VNAYTGEGLAEAVSGASVVVDVSNAPSFEDAAALDFFETSTRNLIAAEADAGVGHHVALSVVGTDRLLDSGYCRAKLAQERLIEKASIPFSIVHATQFFEFVPAIADAATVNGAVRLPPVAFQPISGDDVARVLAHVVTGPPLNGGIEVAGPDRFHMDMFFRDALRTWDDPRQVITDPYARYFGAVPGDHALVPGDGAILGETSYAEWPGRVATG
jgi:uncharacterized protein YbjT (DUF2867 family)